MQPWQPQTRAAGYPNARLALREATTVVHERLHGAAPFAALAAGQLDHDGYAALLRRLLVFHRAVGPSVERGQAALGWDGHDGHRRRIERLAADLDHIGGTAAPAITPADWCGAEAIGCLYVVEGSTLGGKVIHRQLDYLFGDGEAGRRFFAGDRDDGRRWRNLCLRLDDVAVVGRLEAMTRGALAAFALFEACLDEAA